MNANKTIVMARRPKANLDNIKTVEKWDEYIRIAEEAESKCENLHKPTRSEVYKRMRDDYISKFDWTDVAFHVQKSEDK
jgi:hypothetical protein